MMSLTRMAKRHHCDSLVTILHERIQQRSFVFQHLGVHIGQLFRFAMEMKWWDVAATSLREFDRECNSGSLAHFEHGKPYDPVFWPLQSIEQIGLHSFLDFYNACEKETVGRGSWHKVSDSFYCDAEFEYSDESSKESLDADGSDKMIRMTIRQIEVLRKKNKSYSNTVFSSLFALMITKTARLRNEDIQYKPFVHDKKILRSSDPEELNKVEESLIFDLLNGSTKRSRLMFKHDPLDTIFVVNMLLFC